MHPALKVLITAVLVVAITELAKRSSSLGALLASLPLTSLLAFIWLYADTGDAQAVAQLSQSIFWYVLPSLVLFVALPIFIGWGWAFWPSLLLSGALTFAAYLAMVAALKHFGIAL